ncbi:MAG: hypothetical protein J1E62_00800 [Lachnospiraceae bacterium]|nr:hypothetical protein [Lachnospiraceae bacterium]
MTVKENIRRLVKLHMVKNKKDVIISGAIILIFVFVQFFIGINSIVGQNVFEMKYFLNMEIVFYILYAWVIFGGLEGYTMLCDDSISMYPGTIKSRFAARLIWDHMGMLAVLLVSVVAYLLQGLLILFISTVFDGTIVGNAFDLQYLLWGVFRTFGFALLAYSIFTLWYVLLVRFPWIFYVAVGTVVFFGLFSVANIYNAMDITQKTEKICNLYTGRGDYSAYTGILACIATWAVLLFVAWLIGSRAKLWKRQRNTSLYATMVLMYAVFCLCLTGLIMSGMNERTSDKLLPENMGTVVSKSIDVTGFSEVVADEDTFMEAVVLGQKDGQQGTAPDEEQRMEIATEVLSESEAKAMGVSIPEGAVDENHVYMLAWGENTLCKGKDLLKPFLEEYIETVSLQHEEGTPDEEEWKQIQFTAEVKPFICLNNGLYGDIHTFMKNTTYDYGMDGMLESYLRQMVVYSDALKEPPEEN